MQSKEIIEFLKRADSVELISQNLNAGSDEILLRMKQLNPEERRSLAALVKIYRKAEEKLPVFIKSYPALTDKTYEQASSEAMAAFKAGLMQGKRMVNLSGGLGIDDLYFNERFEEVISIDSDSDVHNLAMYNLSLFTDKNIRRICTDAESFDIPEADVIYVDPDRRTGLTRTFLIQDASPDVLKYYLQWLQKAPAIFIKLSPMTDLTEIMRSFDHLSEIHVVALQNEVKEILVKLEHSYKEEPVVYAHIVNAKQSFSYKSGAVLDNIYVAVSNASVFVEAAAALIKANLDLECMGQFGLKRVGSGAAFYEGNPVGGMIPGRVFVPVYKSEFSGQIFSQYLKDYRIERAHVKKRDFPMESEEIKKKYKLKDGGEDYFFFFTNHQRQKVFVHCRKPEVNSSLI